MRASNNTKITWTLAALFLLLLLSGVVLIMMISTVRRGKKENTEGNLIAQLSAAWGEPLPASLKIVQLAPSPRGASMKATGPAVTVVKVRMSEADARKMIQSGDAAAAKNPGDPTPPLDQDETASLWYFLAPQLPSLADESWAFEGTGDYLPAALRMEVVGWLNGPGVATFRNSGRRMIVDQTRKPWDIYLVINN